MIPLGLLLMLRAGEEAAARYSAAILVAFAACALLWLIAPSGGLHPTGGPTGPAFGPFTEIARAIYASNPHYAAAFPSSHVALASAAATATAASGRGRWMYPWALGIAAATMVGQYHYTLDAAFGWGPGWAAARWAQAAPR